MLLHVVAVALAGALGTLARYGTSAAAITVFGSAYPYGTYIVNISGSFLFGAAAGMLPTGSVEWRTILLTGFLGGFTTFSAFAFENHQFLEKQQYVFFAVHCLGQNTLGIAAVIFGLAVAKHFTP
ncbi:MAG: CrcB family protein [Planctomycetaceae bacterium]|jgi:CrcB protein|nr:CrcB family protein [Planctomycetaceae bacterium]